MQNTCVSVKRNILAFVRVSQINIVAPASPCNSQSRVLRELSAAFMQQMFFWGMDAACSSGNVFQKRGFTKTPSAGLKGTSCYSLPWQNGTIFLHGSCVGWIPESGEAGFVFIRPKAKCFLWHGRKPPIPGEWPAENLSTPDIVGGFPAVTPFLSWWLDHEEWVRGKMGSAYRINCHRKYKSLPKSKPWLVPDDATAWLQLFMENPAAAPRSKHFSRALIPV